MDSVFADRPTAKSSCTIRINTWASKVICKHTSGKRSESPVGFVSTKVKQGSFLPSCCGFCTCKQVSFHGLFNAMSSHIFMLFLGAILAA